VRPELAALVLPVAPASVGVVAAAAVAVTFGLANTVLPFASAFNTTGATAAS
jgi:hypothetical protein